MTPDLSSVRKRRDALQRHIADEWPFCWSDQKHLDENTPERAYWHAGYLSALKDVIEFIEKQSNPTP